MRIDMWTDMGCPWCYIGKARLHQAIELAGRADEVELVLHSFELDANATLTPEPIAQMLAKKFGESTENILAMEVRVSDLAAAEGLPFSHQRLHANTFNVHRIMHLAANYGVGTEVFEAVQNEYFAGSSNPYIDETLIRIGGSFGIPLEEIQEVLASDRFTEEVRSDEAHARELGITGVPFTVFARSYALPGAANVAQYLEVIKMAREEAAFAESEAPVD